MKYDLVIRNGYYYDNENDRYIKGDIGINSGVICKIGNINSGKEVIDACGCVILPGFINTHIHFGEYYIKGYSGKLGTLEYIDYAEKFNSLNKGMKEDIRVSSSKICAYEAIKYGETTLMGIRGWDALEKFNARLYMGYPLMKSDKLGEYLNNAFERFESFERSELNNYYIFIHSLLTVDEDILCKLSEYIKGKNIYIAIHLLETESENEKVKSKYGMGCLEVLEKYNLLSERTLLVHCCYLSESDIQMIRKYKCSIVINPNSNLKLKNKVVDYSKLYDINVCIGTDGIATNDSLNILNSLRTMGLLYDISDNELFNMISLNPGKFLSNNTGVIKEGYKADLAIYELNNYKIVRLETFINNLIYSSDIEAKCVIVNGKKIVNDYENCIYSKSDINSLNMSDKIKFNE